MENIPIKSLQDFHNVLSAVGSRAIFRGVPDEEFKLQTTLGRYMMQFLVSEQASGKNYTVMGPEDESNIFNEFKRNAIPFLERRPTNEWEWLTLAQHHGLPTRLLDWTSNPLIAAYFACKDWRMSDTNAAIYAFDNSHKLENHTSPASPFDVGEVGIHIPYHHNERIIAQHGLFTVHPIPTDEFDHPLIFKMVIDNELLIELYDNLNAYGINEAKVFPGLDGIASHIKANY